VQFIGSVFRFSDIVRDIAIPVLIVFAVTGGIVLGAELML
jgi:hypothetical protein